ncbi:1,4-dihydroxy-2-naphthoyl-CoA thioesterase 1-like [Zingiber officinale]|uniref:1,4-dihydroxy-2-naphthoyl-CoA thioesterase 1-like n=1 Tax=Zingiber officinale TaxID=94328 RepID=UPI001C4BE9FC|nr:1,4-dihydroxy-2-naphthoyl-CoA thioesterase 1-like [Zingiber officinale]XP_042460030.1 1,4-dihydroxy-2-naphthoyl-CoA thioesterase 1-like [Zingiber officinale]
MVIQSHRPLPPTFLIFLPIHIIDRNLSLSDSPPQTLPPIDRSPRDGSADEEMARNPSPPAKSKTSQLDAALHNIGFEIDLISPAKVNGRLTVTDSCCQPFKVLHGGISAMMAEALASIGAHVASGFRRVAGIQLSINHHRSARSGDRVFVEATPLQLGKTIQVWEVQLWKMDMESGSEKGVLISSARVTLLVNLPVPDHAKEAEETLKKYARL